MQERTALLAAWAQKQVANDTLSLTLISGDASFRRYFRAAGLIWVDAPPATEKNREFVRNAAALAAAGLLAPRVLAVDYQMGFLCVTDLGDCSLLSVLDETTVTPWYDKAIDLLPQLAAVELDLEAFDAPFMARENAILPEWLLGKHLGLALDAGEQALLARTFDLLTANNLTQAQGVMHRDFHSRNLMVCGEPSPARGELAVIDFQDMVLGPVTYDLVSLLKDCYVRWPDAVIEAGMQRGYRVLAAAGRLGDTDYASFRRQADLTGMQRHLKAAGIFARLHHRDGKSGYLKDIPRTLNYVVEVCSRYGELAEFGRWLGARVLPALAAVSELQP